VSIEVTTVDHLPGRHPTYRDVEASAEGGRGLEIVHALSHGYSVLRHDNERVTECQVTTSDDGAALVEPADAAPPRSRAEHGKASRPTKEEGSQPCTSE
jgi:hypothetical protein